MEKLSRLGVLVSTDRGPRLVPRDRPNWRFRKLVVPARSERAKLYDQAGRLLLGHYFLVERVVRDSRPDDPARGVLFVEVRHVPECDRCAWRTTGPTRL